MSTKENSPPEPITSPSEIQSASLSMPMAIGICAGGLLICFFLPWIQFFARVSGFELAKEGGKYLLFWSIPILCVLTIIAVVTKKSPKIVAILTGILPFLALASGLNEAGRDLMQMLAPGGYVSLVLGLVLLILPFRLK